MDFNLTSYCIITLLMLFAELGYFRIAEKLGIVDKPNQRSSHQHITLRGGGIVFLFGLWLYAAFFGLQYLWFLLGVSLIGIISFVDDIHSLPDKYRLIIQFTAMFLIFYQFGILHWSDWWLIIIALIVAVGIINAFNFMDGINGITGVYGLAVMIPLIYLNSLYHFVSASLLIVTSLSLIIFLFFNFRSRARCFAGDVGSITIAYIVVFTLGLLILKTGNVAYLVLIAVYGADTILTICHRIKLHENLGEAHRKHAFQIMANELKIPHLYVSAFYFMLQLLISAGIIFLPINPYLYLGLIIIILGFAYLMFIRKYYHLHEEYLKSLKK